MYEIAGARQPEIPGPSQGYRRLFANEEYTLHVWYDRRDGRMTEFHIFYGRTRSRRVSWAEREPAVRDGEVTEHGFWGADGLSLPASFDADRFREAIASIDPEVRSAVLRRINRSSSGSGS